MTFDTRTRLIWLFAAAGVIAMEAVAAAQTVALTGDRAVGAPRFTVRAAASLPLAIHVSFALRNPAKLDELLRDLQDPASPRYHHWLTPAQFDARFGRNTAEVAAVKAWLASYNFRVTGASALGVRYSATVAQAERAFGARIMASGDGLLYANLDEPRIPLRFESVIASIDGLDNLRHAQPAISPNKHRPRAIVPDFGKSLPIQAFGPSDVHTFYDETSLLNAGTNGGGGDCLGVVEISDYLDASVGLFDTTFSLPAANVTRVLADGVNPGTNTNEQEALIDIEWAHAVAPGAPINVYIGAFGGALQDAIENAVRDNQCGAISISYIFCGNPPSFFTGTLDPLFAEAAAQGQSVFVDSGDHGAAGYDSNCQATSSRSISEMAADPNVTAVGGTEFNPVYDSNNNDLSFVTETVWNDSLGASGGGQSAVFSKPAYQGSATPNDGSRDTPDVSIGASQFAPGFFLGDDAQGAVIDCCFGGTSLGTPLWAGVSKLVAQVKGGRIGNLNPRIYQLGALGNASQSGLRPVTTGDNSFNGVAGFVAKPGYNQATGWGSVDIAAFVTAFLAPVLPPTPTPTATPTAAATPSATPTPTPTATPTTVSASLTVAPRSLTFGNLTVGKTSKAQLVTLSNPRNKKQGQTITVLAITPSVDFGAPAGVCVGPLAAGKSCKLPVTFSPTLVGLRTGQITIRSNATDGSVIVQLKGRGKVAR